MQRASDNDRRLGNLIVWAYVCIPIGCLVLLNSPIQTLDNLYVISGTGWPYHFCIVECEDGHWSCHDFKVTNLTVDLAFGVFVIAGVAFALQDRIKSHAVDYSTQTWLAIAAACATYLGILAIEFKQGGYDWEDIQVVAVEETCRFVVFVCIGIAWYSYFLKLRKLLPIKRSPES